MQPEIKCFIGCDVPFEEADTVIFGAPFDSTTSFRPGTRFGPAAMRSESFGIETYSPYQDKDLLDLKVFDSGDLELRFGSPESALDDIEARTKEILDAGKLPIMLGGEHLVTLEFSVQWQRNMTATFIYFILTLMQTCVTTILVSSFPMPALSTAAMTS